MALGRFCFPYRAVELYGIHAQSSLHHSLNLNANSASQLNKQHLNLKLKAMGENEALRCGIWGNGVCDNQNKGLWQKEYDVGLVRL